MQNFFANILQLYFESWLKTLYFSILNKDDFCPTVSKTNKEKDKQRRCAVNLLLCARSYDVDCYFAQAFLPLDIFKQIMNFSHLLFETNFLKEKEQSRKMKKNHRSVTNIRFKIFFVDFCVILEDFSQKKNNFSWEAMRRP